MNFQKLFKFISLNFRGYLFSISKRSGINHLYSVLLLRLLNNPSKNLNLIAVTGTNGKSTTTYLIHQALRNLNYKSGLISPIHYLKGDHIYYNHLTTPKPYSLRKILIKMIKNRCSYCVMEASSIGICENRIDGLRFKAAVFTNLTWDHIHFHGSMEEYANTKAKLFRNLSSNSIAVVNRDDPYQKKITEDTPAHLYFYGMAENSNLRENDKNVTYFTILSNTIDGVTLNLDGIISTFNLTGEFNAYNLAAAYTFLKASGFDREQSINALEKAAAPPGRFQIIHKEAGGSCPKKVIVDYAHTPDALKKVLQAVVEIRNPGAKLILVFGCTGDRDKKKRPLMGTVAEKYADQIFLTSDDSYSEETSVIIQQITEGMIGSAYIIEENRKLAIERAIFESPEDSVVLIAGKGHEKFQFLQGKKYEHSDIEYTKKIFGNYLHRLGME